MTYDLENIENSIDGYKYVLELSINIEDPLDSSNGDRICICDTRDECIEQIKLEIERYIKANEKCGHPTEAEPYNITRLGTYIKWHTVEEPEKTWWWSFGIYPVKYLTQIDQIMGPTREAKETSIQKAMEEFQTSLKSEQKDLDPEIGKLIEDNFYDLL